MNQVEPFKAAEDLPGLGRFYCVQCAKWFESEPNLLHHRRGKKHKRRYEDLCIYAIEKLKSISRVRLLQEEPYTQKEAEAAVRLSTDNGTASESLRTTKDSEPMDIER